MLIKHYKTYFPYQISQKIVIFNKNKFLNTQICIVGGGLAGLTAAIDLRLKGFEVVLIEKQSYPNHKVCGEYISNEVKPYLIRLGLSEVLETTTSISKLKLSHANGDLVEAQLPLGGIGVSRYYMDFSLYKHAKSLGVTIIKDKALGFTSTKHKFHIQLSKHELAASYLLLAHGKRSNLDKNLQREFIQKKTDWVGIKAHYKLDNFPDDEVQLHNFKGGYCGLSKTESNEVNCCYLVTDKMFKPYKNSTQFNAEVLSKNPHLSRFFKTAKPLFERDLAIAQISFSPKTQSQSDALYLGDAAGLIHPLCGNGMAMAIHSAKLASEAIFEAHQKQFSLNQLTQNYKQSWQQHFKSRLLFGRLFQRALMNPKLTHFGLKSVQTFPSLLPSLIKLTHGQTF